MGAHAVGKGACREPRKLPKSAQQPEAESKLPCGLL